MKMVFAMILLFSLYDAQALEFKVSRMKKTPGFDLRYDLKTNLNEVVALDCQSFVQGLMFGPYAENVVMLQEWECQELLTDMKKSHQHLKQHCLDVDVDQSLLNSSGRCP